MEKELDRFFSELTTINGELLRLSSVLSKYSLIQGDKLADSKFKFAHLSRLVISDIIGETDNGWFLRFGLKPTYEVWADNLTEKTEEIINKQASLSIVLSFESLKKFMRFSIIYYFKSNPQEGKKLLKIKTNGKNINWEKRYNEYSNKQKDIELQTLCEISDTFKFGIESNNYNIRINDYISSLTKIRNGIIHNSFVLTKDNYNAIGALKDGKYIIEHFFPLKNSDKNYLIHIDVKTVQKNINLIAEIGFLVFKSFSNLLNYNSNEYLKNN